MSFQFRDQAQALISYAKARLTKARDYQAVYGSPEGQRVLIDILRRSGVLTVSHVAGDPGTSQFNDGARSVGLYLCEQLRWNEPELVALARLQTGEDLEQT